MILNKEELELVFPESKILVPGIIYVHINKTAGTQVLSDSLR